MNGIFIKIQYLFFLTLFIHSLAQRTNQETSTPYQTTPDMGSLNLKCSETKHFSAFWYRGTRDGYLWQRRKAGHAMVIYGSAEKWDTRWIFVGWRMERKLKRVTL